MKIGYWFNCNVFCIGYSDPNENGSSGDTTEDLMLDIQNSGKSPHDQQSNQNQGTISNQDKEYNHSLWSNSSRYYSLLLIFN